MNRDAIRIPAVLTEGADERPVFERPLRFATRGEPGEHHCGNPATSNASATLVFRPGRERGAIDIIRTKLSRMT